MTGKKTKLGATLDAWCSKCKAVGPHGVETVKKDTSAGQVRCQACSSVHAYRASGGAAASGKKPASGAAGGKRRKKGEAAVGENEAGRAKPYAMDAEFAVGDIVDHPKFGLGRVTALRPGGKMEASFEGGTRLLVCKDVGGATRGRARPARVVVPEVEVEEAEVGDEDVETPDIVEVREEE